MNVNPVCDGACEVGCGAGDAWGVGLCVNHLDEWLRSPERRALAYAHDEVAWDEALSKFVARKHREARDRRHAN